MPVWSYKILVRQAADLVRLVEDTHGVPREGFILELLEQLHLKVDKITRVSS